MDFNAYRFYPLTPDEVLEQEAAERNEYARVTRDTQEEEK